MLTGLIITDEELMNRLCEYYDRHDIVEIMGLDAKIILDMFWDRVQEHPELFSDVLTGLDYADKEKSYV
jgi:hypothetical protein|tara:strand:+ start:8961 stop:9167 length:207 start_codon:yes stop_codon:yes gene_type:complete